jgi:hypothetical protein
MRSASILVLFLTTSVASAAPFEGTLSFEFSGSTNGQAEMTLGKAGSRVEVQMQTPKGQGGPKRMTLLTRTDTPNKAFMLDDARKTYLELDLQAMRQQQPKEPTYEVKKIGPELVNGFDTTHVSVTASDGNLHELWLTKALGEVQDFKLPESPGSTGEALRKAMAQVGAEGFPVKHVQRLKKAGSTMSMELKKSKAHPVPSGTFEIPKGYTAGSSISGSTVPQDPKRMEMLKKAMEQMPPEQRKELEEQLKLGK